MLSYFLLHPLRKKKKKEINYLTFTAIIVTFSHLVATLLFFWGALV